MARDIRHFETIDSTNRVGFDLAREGAAHGTVVIAEGQTAGRGRLGRSFELSAAQEPLYLGGAPPFPQREPGGDRDPRRGRRRRRDRGEGVSKALTRWRSSGPTTFYSMGSRHRAS